jgi:hypothetical protein
MYILSKTYTFCAFLKNNSLSSRLSSFLLLFTLIGKCILAMPTLKQLQIELSAAKAEIVWSTLHGRPIRAFPTTELAISQSLHSRKTFVLTFVLNDIIEIIKDKYVSNIYID